MNDFRITVGTEYLYTAPRPAGCQGHRYRVIQFVMLVPSYQEQVLVLALTGPDEGRHFVCTPANFSSRYRPVPVVQPEPAPPMPDKIAGRVQRENG
jgi:hypothetical protein